MSQTLERKSRSATRTVVLFCLVLGALVSGLGVAIGYWKRPPQRPVVNREAISFQEKKPIDTGGFTAVLPTLDRWPPTASLEEISAVFQAGGLPEHREDRPAACSAGVPR